MSELRIVEANQGRVHELTSMALALWPDNNSKELQEEFAELLESEKDKLFLCVNGQDSVAFIHLSIRSDYVEGSSSSPVGYVEGIYVKPEFRRQGISKRLVQAGEQWCRSMGCTQMASDIEQHNTASYDFHLSIGFTEANRIIAFIKEI